MLRILVSLLTVMAPNIAMANKALAAKDVDKVLRQYRSAEGFQAEVKKTVAQEVLGTETTGDGRFYFSKGKLRLEMEQPESTILVYDGRFVWMETRLDESTIEVTKIKSRELKRNDSLLAALFDRKNILNTFKMISAKFGAESNTYVFEPRNKKKTEIRLLEISIEGKVLKKISYKDDRENKVTFEFKNIVREPIKSELFAYKPPKGANVTEM